MDKGSRIRLGLRVMIVCGCLLVPGCVLLVGPHFVPTSRLAPTFVPAFPSPGWYEAMALIGFAAGLLVVFYRLVRENGESVTAGPSAQETPRAVSRWSYGLRDLLLGFVIIGIACAVLRFVRGKPLVLEWRGFVGTAACLVVIQVASACSALLRRGWLLAVVAIFLAVGGAASLHTWGQSDWTGAEAILWLNDGPSIFKTFLVSFLVLAALTMGITYLLILAGALAGSGGVHGGHDTIRRTTRFVLAGVCLVLYLPLGVLYVRMLRELPPPDRPQPPRNAMAEILAASRDLLKWNSAESTLAEIRNIRHDAATSRKVAAAYREMMAALERPAAVQIDWKKDVNPNFIPNLLPEIQMLRSIARTWEREARASAAAGRFDEALQYDLATVRLGVTQQHGGVMVHELVGIAIEGIGTHQLVSDRKQLATDDRGRLLEALKAIDEDRDPWMLAVTRDAVWSDRTYTWRATLERESPTVLALVAVAPEEGLVTRAAQPSMQAFRDAARRRDATMRLLIADTAIGLFQEDRGRWPETLEELCPEYLAAVPLDPYAGQPLIYRRDGDGFVLYSVGSDLKDDGGKMGVNTDYLRQGIDFDVEMSIRNPPPQVGGATDDG
jgi:hypothetical protein